MAAAGFEKSLRTGETTIVSTEEPYTCRARVTACPRMNI